MHCVISSSSRIHTAKDNTLPVTNLEKQENSCLKLFYHMKNTSNKTSDMEQVII